MAGIGLKVPSGGDIVVMMQSAKRTRDTICPTVFCWQRHGAVAFAFAIPNVFGPRGNTAHTLLRVASSVTH